MMKKLLIILSIGLSFKILDAKFPDDPKPCKYGDSECITKLTNYFVQQRSDGDKAINMIKIDPLRISKINIKQGADNPVNIDLTFTDNDLIGLKHLNILTIKGFSKDIKTKYQIMWQSDVINLVGDYTINGKVLILPIHGKGKSNITLINSLIEMVFDGEPYEKDGGIYMKATKLQINIKPEHVYYYFSNLFDGDKALGDNMNAFLNENWSDIYRECRDSIHNAFSRIFEAIINNIFSKYPYKKFFLEV